MPSKIFMTGRESSQCHLVGVNFTKPPVGEGGGGEVVSGGGRGMG